jgi:hypothetical protein
MDPDICPYCGQEVDEGLDDWCETPRGIAHDICYAEWLDDEDGRAADFYFDTAGDR